jgi:predicted phosphate transport protein (TIGR00153 family)
MPTTNPLASLFGRNPFRSLQEHMAAVVECVELVPSLFESILSNDESATEQIKDDIFEKEANADRVKNELRLHLPRSMFLPVDRRDLLDVLDMQDSIADVAQDIAGLLYERRMAVPDPLRADLPAFVDQCVAVCRSVSEIIDHLDEMLELGFRSRKSGDIDEMISHVNALEDTTDRLEMKLARTLFRHEESLPPVSVIFWHQLLEWIGDIADYAEKVANRLRLMIAT